MELKDADLTGFTSFIVFASFREAPNLEMLLTALGPKLAKSDMIIISDDSGASYRSLLEAACSKGMLESAAQICFSYSVNKSGRGAAVRRAFEIVQEKSMNAEKYIEADSDGSHRADDILKILDAESKADLIIGSRYSKGSKITGWPISRRIFSRVLNWTIPTILGVPSSDLTNGLRRYNATAVGVMLNKLPKNSGFIYLSETAYHISKSKLRIEDVPIHFENRVFGSSTVGTEEILMSMKGLAQLIITRIRDLARL